MTVSLPAGCADGLLAGRYRLDERIAVGGMGEVWRGEDTVLGRTVAVKCLKPEYVHDPEFRERFRAEARHAAGLSHPGIASVYDYGEQVEPDVAAWLVMELVDGEPLSALLHRGGRLAPARTLDIVGQVASALEAAHVAGVVHRDVKPGNLLVRPDGVVKVTDFGIARATDAVPLTRTGTVVGTAYYLSPEQASGGPVTPASDVYSLGVVAYECLAGVRPFPGDNPLAVATAHLRSAPPPLPADVPAGVRELVLRAMDKDPARRPAGAAALGRDALALRAGLTGSAPTEVPAEEQVARTRVLAAAPAGAASSAASPATPPPTPPPSSGLARPVPRALPPRAQNHQRAVRLAAALLAVVVLALSARACLAEKTVQVPMVAAGSSVDAATAALTARNFLVDRTTATSSSVPEGAVIGTVPEGGSSARDGDTVHLVVSSGRPDVPVDPATYAGMTKDTAVAALTALGLRPTVAYDGSGRPAGTVSDVTPSGSLAHGAAVTVHVVPAPVPVQIQPWDRGKNKDKKDEDEDQGD
jgi:beta-lactam-binding protein with PASTA domain